MKSNAIAVAILAVVISAATIVLAQQPAAKPSSDPRLDKIIEQNSQILKGQQDMQKELDEIKEGMLQVRRRTS